jgi:diguanylate cyclase (GGDEF)-like protein
VKPRLLILLDIFTRGILVYFLLINAVYILFIVLSAFGILRHFRWTRFLEMKEILSSPMAKPISIIVPAFNEESGIVESVRSLLSLEYPQFEVIVVNDGSTDATLARLAETFSLKPVRRIFRKVLECKPIRGIYTSSEYSQLVLVDKVNGHGKADALNAGLNIARFPLFCAIDGDSLLDRDSLLRIARPFIEDPGRVMAVGGVIRLSNGCLIRHGRAVSLRLPRNSLAQEATHDFLTGVLNRRAIVDRLAREISRARREEGTLSVGMFDIDHFKDINDAYGHQAGDEALVAFARRIHDRVRDYDSLGRYGGDEFLLIAPGSMGHSDEKLYERLRVAVADAEIATNAGTLSLTVSIGVAPGTGMSSVDALLATADAALYQAKAEGRNRVAYAVSPSPPGL